MTGPRISAFASCAGLACMLAWPLWSAAQADASGARPASAVPQVNVPLGRDSSASQPARRAAPAASAASMAGVDDAVARCEAERDKHVRAACRARLAREGRVAR